eukprot:TRINITY_DN14935_c0_g1_i1.p1 TRINITY_DN14935_c0_g1~~TRINITY_DN14935_c0_g1_i1.p1  ORF type:complete len:262 (+),score=0.47 TRINITY_DN14935_c0_g1_i1:64-849(+)
MSQNSIFTSLARALRDLSLAEEYTISLDDDFDSEDEHWSDQELSRLLGDQDISRLLRIRRSPIPCKFFLMGRCNRLTCRFSHHSPNSQSSTHSPSSPASRVHETVTTCRFFQNGFCRNGDSCSFSHVTRDTLKESENTSSVVPNEKKDCHDCAICFENVTEKGQKFGLLTGCDHVFCLNCIRKWRQNYDMETSVIRTCPICRKPSHYVIPSDQYVEGNAKIAIETSYKNKMRSIPCKYYDYGKGACPFGDFCFYSHRTNET